MKAAIREEKEERPNQQNLASGPVSFCKFVSRTRTNIYYTGNRIGTKRHRVAADLSHAFPITEEAALLPIWSTSSPFPKFGQHWTRFGTVFFKGKTVASQLYWATNKEVGQHCSPPNWAHRRREAAVREH